MSESTLTWQTVIAIAQKALGGTDKATESDWSGILAGGLEDIIKLCTSVYPTDYFQRIEELWRIAQEVAETHSTFHEHYSHDMACPFCDGVQGWACDDGVIHQPECIVIKARELTQWRKQIPQIVLETKKESEE